MFYGLCGNGGEEEYTDLVFRKSWIFEGEEYTLVQNVSAETKNIQLFTEKTTVRQILGEGAVLRDGVLTFAASSGEICFFKMQATEEMGLYDGNVSVSALYPGTFSLRGTDGAALYNMTSGTAAEMIAFWKGEEIVIDAVCPGYILKLYHWNMLSPLEKSCIIKAPWND